MDRDRVNGLSRVEWEMYGDACASGDASAVPMQVQWTMECHEMEKALEINRLLRQKRITSTEGLSRLVEVA